ncbi:MAG: M56 family metallopeptidase [Candidatus Kuenenia stuttgartiensis]|jgi:Zn-dependent protease with chaperone function|uniref:Regulatory protein BlaR1 n=1 Tax=Kuenenia stuttgartiensis TaxID=174633 RepID=Q1Q4U8_KUEST|nr:MULTISPECIES: M56 family metallopeptidase [Kuenenia]MBE7547135.1 M56 family metallopeptidase [Planctomycetia bacterium]MBZ0192951.1 M56 family metallopeptidase [Candidatus Kuenenia stuttgartiensis]MCF6152046.1 M56 family peptidase [Candidatus Kuenenia stuttgartiensis]MCL4727253.1 M56 family metallopeptidase [Candidatus Kuenenia stuttgartiensis]MCZ7621335.1 M56 family metallopeptidase [Candidatus Kuenenia sp.]
MENKGGENVSNNQQKNADKCFALFLLINSIIASAFVAGILVSVNSYIKGIFNTYHSATCCGSICLNCLFSFYTLCLLFYFLCMGIYFVGVGRAFYKAFLLFTINRSLFRSLGLTDIKEYPIGDDTLNTLPCKNSPIFVSGQKIFNAFTFGIFRPKICLSAGLFSYLTPKELQSVVLHEFHHLKHRDPLRFAIMQIFCALHFFLPVNNYLVRLYKMHSEKAADDAALRLMNEPLALASALVKMSGYNTKHMTQIAIASFSNEQQAFEERISRLVEPKVSSFSKGGLFAMPCYLSVVSVFFSGILFSSVYFHTHLLTSEAGCKEGNCHMVTCKE